jgi:ParB family chromosome partitioning protein
MSEMRQVELKLIHPNRLNPRLEINIEKLNELSNSIRKVGVLQPIVVRPMRDGGFEVVVGERRYRAAQQAKLDKVPAIIRDFTDGEVIELNLVENIQREDLSVVEKAKSCKKLKDMFPEKYPTWNKVAEKIGVSIQTIEVWVHTLGLPEEVQRLIAPREVQRVPEGRIDYLTANRLGRRIKEPEKQVKMAREIAERHIPQREANRIIREVAKEPEKPIEEVVTRIIEEPYELPFRLDHMQPILNGTKIQTSRAGIPDPKVKVGAIVHAAVWEPHFADLRVTNIERKKLRYFNEDDAKREGGYTLEEFKRVWELLHGDWDENQIVFVIHFEKVK